VFQGKLIPPNHYKIKLWMRGGESKTALQNEMSINNLIDLKFKDFKELDEIIASNETKLEDLKALIQSILLDKFENNDEYENVENLRLRLMKRMTDESNLSLQNVNFQLKKVLIDWHKPLKQLGIIQETDLFVQILDEDAVIINQGIIVLDCVRATLKTKMCLTPTYKQITWNVNNGATLSSLRESILKAYSDELQPSDLFRMNIVKRVLNKSQWILIKEINNNPEKSSTNNQSINCNNSASTGKHKKKKGNPNSQQQSATQVTHKANLKAAPYHMDDGDIIAFTLSEGNESITAQDFMSEEDLEISKKSNITKAEMIRLRKERKQDNQGGAKRKGFSRPEVGITIKIDNFN
jgi:hypothetical protein